MDKFIEEEFRKVVSREIQSAKRRFTDGERYLFDALLQNNKDSEFDSQEFLNSAGETFAFACELGLKSNIIYDDFRRNKFFTQTIATNLRLGDKIVSPPIVGTEEWRQALAGNIKTIDFISEPKKIRKIILDDNPDDERSNIKTEPQYNSDFLTLSKDGSIPSGHSLYAYTQLQSPIAKNLINTEYYCYVDNEVKYTIYALLTEDILTNHKDGKTIVPMDFMEKLDAVKDAAVKLRYASISANNIGYSELTFLKEFSSSVINVGEYRFPLPKQYANIDFERYKYDDFVLKDLSLFDSLDKITKYNLQSCFNKNEIGAFIKYIELLKKTGISPIDLNVFINNAIYLKNFVKNKMQIDLKFTEAQFGRIDKFCKLLKAFQPFDPNSKRLRDNEAFSTEEQIAFYINKINQNQFLVKLQKAIRKLEFEYEETDFDGCDIGETIIANENKIYRIQTEIALSEERRMRDIKRKSVYKNEDALNEIDKRIANVEEEIERDWKECKLLVEDNRELSDKLNYIRQKRTYIAKKLTELRTKAIEIEAEEEKKKLEEEKGNLKNHP